MGTYLLILPAWLALDMLLVLMFASARGLYRAWWRVRLARRSRPYAQL